MTVPKFSCHRLCLLYALTCLLFPLASGMAFAAPEEAGRVISLTPSGWAERNGERIPLALKTSLYKTDVIHTDATGKAQILFADDTTVSVAPNTQIRLEEFVFDESNANFAMQLTGGMARVVTGKIVKMKPENFNVVTPQGTIGIRGTDCTIVANASKTTVIANRITTNDIRVINKTTGEVSSISKSGMVVETAPTGNISRPATEVERATATQAMRQQPVATTAQQTEQTSQTTETATTQTAQATQNTQTTKTTQTTQTTQNTQTTQTTRDTQTAQTAQPATTRQNMSSVPQPGVGSLPRTSVADLNTPGIERLPAIEKPGAVTPSPDPTPPPVTPTPPPVVDPTPPPVVDPTPPPVTPTPPPVVDPTPPPVTPTPPPVVDPTPPPVNPTPPPVVDPTPPPVTPTPPPVVDPTPPPVNPTPPPVIPDPPKPIPNPSGTFTGSLIGNMTPRGTFQFNVKLDTGAINDASMELSTDGVKVLGAYAGTGDVNARAFTVNNWSTVLSKGEIALKPSLKGEFTSDANTLSGVTWKVKDGEQGTLWNGTGTNFAQNDALPAITGPLKGSSGTFSGGLAGGAGDANIAGAFQFEVNTADGSISKAEILLRDNTSRQVLGVTGGTGKIVPTGDFSVKWANAPEPNTPKVGAEASDPALSGSINGQNLTGVTWNFVLGKGQSGEKTIAGDAGNISHSPDSQMSMMDPSKISGSFHGDLGVPSDIHGTFRFSVLLGSGQVSDAQMNIHGPLLPDLVSAAGGNAVISGTRDFAVTTWGNVNLHRDITNGDPNFIANPQLAGHFNMSGDLASGTWQINNADGTLTQFGGAELKGNVPYTPAAPIPPSAP